MDYTVADSPLLAILGLVGVVGLLLVLIARYRWHVFFALLAPILLFGVLPGVERNGFIAAFESGFGSTLGKIGVVIVLGSVLAVLLEKSGAIEVITGSLVRLLGRGRMPLALTLAGFVLGVAVFSDVAYVILNPLVHSSAAAAGMGVAGMATGLVGALQLTHAIVPPTPGPLAAAALVGANLGKTIVFGGLACLAGSLASWLWGEYVAGRRIKTPPKAEFSTADPDADDEPRELPSVLASYLPIAVPVLLIAADSVAAIVFADSLPAALRSVLGFVGWPVIALSLGVVLAYRNLKTAEARSKARSKWVETGLRTSAMILAVTGLGGSLSAILRGTPAVDFIAEGFVDLGLPAILLPFSIGVIGNMITGSTTVGVITAGALVAPMLPSLGLSPEAAMLAGASGSVIIKYVNSSYFWVCTTLSGLEPRDAIFSYGGATLVGGLVSFAVVWTLWGVGIL